MSQTAAGAGWVFVYEFAQSGKARFGGLDDAASMEVTAGTLLPNASLSHVSEVWRNKTKMIEKGKKSQKRMCLLVNWQGKRIAASVDRTQYLQIPHRML